jgi:colanic acid/amylovoran biosynthesis glycosyltransferase
MKVAYITAQTPYGENEQFILPEIISFSNNGTEILVLPLRPDKVLFEGLEPKIVSEYTLAIPLFSKEVILLSIVLFLRSPIKCFKMLGKIILHSGSLKKIYKNLAVFGKGLAYSEVLKRHNVEHVHAHWAGTTSTAAYIAAGISDIPWSFTCHRWDIAENNMLKEKVKSSRFVRVINDNGYNEVIQIVGDLAKTKCHKLHVGINVSPEEVKGEKDKNVFTITVPANMVEVKGHIYLIEAINILIKKGYELKCNLYGDGILGNTLKNKVKALGLEKVIIFNNKLAHDKLLSIYKEGYVDCVLLPSIVTETEKEGIPVSLMEAMAYRIPVIATDTGGIPELLTDGAGIIVKEKDPLALAEGIRCLMENKSYYEIIAQKGYNRVYEEFYLPQIVDKLIELMK